MISLILVLLLITCAVSWFIYQAFDSDGAWLVWSISSTGIIIFLITFIGLLVGVLNGQTIDSKIELYQSQNTEIESKIQATVASYLAHEKQTYKDLKPDNAIAVVSAYPELHSNELVKKQVEVYEDNNKKILGLKEEKLNQSIYKWWLFFGR